MKKIKRWAFLESAKLILVKFKGEKYIKTYTLEEARKEVPEIVDKILAEKI